MQAQMDLKAHLVQGENYMQERTYTEQNDGVR